ncbi:MAG TPA: hypothetical protein DEF12_09505 [Rhodobacteraceae bacterium]|jgi:hypothetical protein|nr:hypothetical protein [Paracoccaceae bacterium]
MSITLPTAIATLHRPGLLVRSARAGLEWYRRDSHLRRLLGPGRPPAIGAALAPLMAAEEMLEQERRSGHIGYSAVRHVSLLIAILAEAQMMRVEALVEGEAR